MLQKTLTIFPTRHFPKTHDISTTRNNSIDKTPSLEFSQSPKSAISTFDGDCCDDFPIQITGDEPAVISANLMLNFHLHAPQATTGLLVRPAIKPNAHGHRKAPLIETLPQGLASSLRTEELEHGIRCRTSARPAHNYNTINNNSNGSVRFNAHYRKDIMSLGVITVGRTIINRSMTYVRTTTFLLIFSFCHLPTMRHITRRK